MNRIFFLVIFIITHVPIIRSMEQLPLEGGATQEPGRPTNTEEAMQFIMACRRRQAERAAAAELEALEAAMRNLSLDADTHQASMERKYARHQARKERFLTESHETITRPNLELAEDSARAQLHKHMLQEERDLKNHIAQRKVLEEEYHHRQRIFEEELQTRAIIQPLILDFLRQTRELETQKRAFKALEEASREQEATLTQRMSMSTIRADRAEQSALQAEAKAKQALQMFEQMQKTHRAISYTAQAIWQIYDKTPKALAILGFAASISPEDYLINMIGDSARTIRQMSAYVGAIIATVDFLIKNHKDIRARLVLIRNRMGVIKQSMENSYDGMLPLSTRFKERAIQYARSAKEIAKESWRTLGRMQNALGGISDSDSESGD